MLVVVEGPSFGRFIELSNARRMIELDTTAAYQKKLVSNIRFLIFFFVLQNTSSRGQKKGKESVGFNGLCQLHSTCPP